MNAFLLFLSSFTIVFAFAFQQHNVHYRRYRLAVATALLIDALHLVLLKLGAAATVPEMMAFLIGGPLGTLAAMWLNDKLFVEAEAMHMDKVASNTSQL